MLPFFLFLSAFTFLSLTVAQGEPSPNRCVSNAYFNETTKRCTCDDGFKGSSRLCCGPKDQGVCYLISDPLLNTAHDLISEVSFPCTTSIAVIKKDINGLECNVRITIAGPYRRDGSLFYDRSAVYLQYGGSSQYMELLDNKRFKLPEESNETMTMDTKDAKIIRVGEIEFSVRFENENDRWVIKGCDGQLVYRAPGPNTAESRPPGICVIAPTDLIAESLSGGEVCNLEPGYDPKPYYNKEQSILANMILGYSKISAKHNFDPADYEPVCRRVSGNFAACGDDSAKAFAIRVCGPILLGFPNRQCFNKAQFGIFNFFDFCIQALCQKNRAACTTIQSYPEVRNCLPELQKCNTW